MDMEVILFIGIILLLFGLLVGLLIFRHMREKKIVKLKCSSCGDISCVVITQNRLGHMWPGANYKESGFIDPFMFNLSETQFEDWLIGEQDNYSYCEKCGYFEKIKPLAPNKSHHPDAAKLRG